MRKRNVMIVVALAVAFDGGVAFMLWRHYRPATPRYDHGHAIVDLRATGNFPLVPSLPDGGAPKPFRDLDGKPVAIDGFVYDPNTAGDQTRQFQFVYTVPSHGVPLVQE